MKGFLLMITFLTRIPIKINFKYKSEDFLNAIFMMPLVGLIIGGFMYLVALSSRCFDKPVVSVFIWVCYIWITGGLHIDGLADSIDGVFSNRGKERALEIMKDSRVGTFGVLAIFLVYALNIVLTSYVEIGYIILTPIVGRCCAVFAASISVYARPENGMGKGIVETCGTKEAVLAIMITAVASYLCVGVEALAILLWIILITIGLVKYFTNRIGGMTGDTIGFTVEFMQSIFLLISYVVITLTKALPA